MRRVYARLAWLGDSCGQDLIEYALVMVLVALAAAASMTGVANAINQVFTSIGGTISTYAN